jgi:hypothetical protein
MPPPNGARGVLLNNKLFIFGGFHEKTYFADRSLIDPATGNVAPVRTSGDISSTSPPDYRSCSGTPSSAAALAARSIF